MSHTSGNNNFYEGDFVKTEKSKYKNVSDFVPLFANDTLLSHPGTKYDYSSSGFVILGLIIESVSGQNYYDYVRKNIFFSKIAVRNNHAITETLTLFLVGMLFPFLPGSGEWKQS